MVPDLKISGLWLFVFLILFFSFYLLFILRLLQFSLRGPSFFCAGASRFFFIFSFLGLLLWGKERRGGGSVMDSLAPHPLSSGEKKS